MCLVPDRPQKPARQVFYVVEKRSEAKRGAAETAVKRRGRVVTGAAETAVKRRGCIVTGAAETAVKGCGRSRYGRRENDAIRTPCI